MFIFKDLEAADNEIENDASKMEKILQIWDFPTHDDLKKRITKLRLKLGYVSKQTLVLALFNISIFIHEYIG